MLLISLLQKYKDSLAEERQVNWFGTAYEGRTLDGDEKETVWIYPVSFFYRRTIFCIFTVVLID